MGIPYVDHTDMCGLYGWVFFTEKFVEMGTFFNLHTSVYKEVIRNRHKIAKNSQNNNHKKDVKKCDKYAYKNQKW